jgi:hypothetical protein
MSGTEVENIWANPLVRHLAIILIAKVALLALLWWLFFRVPHGGVAAAPDVSSHIAGPAAGAVSNPTD